ncbi:unnamed protein product [Candidula unifasciata]|uniref:Translin-associated factor X-interacting protein 1 N-terminal domain-containing protein n=1 Tax=Candidula unifasciata TaxID=100452 RepID=A0A8S3Z6C2_9EUPU|nr:unnamed protein product [Candidula unifasciata]
MAYKFILGRHIKSILNDVEDQQKKDIKDFAGGHLNESWASAYKETVDLTKPMKPQHQGQVSRKERSAKDVLYDFALGPSGVIPSSQGNAGKMPEIRYKFMKDSETDEKKTPRQKSAGSLYSELDDGVLVEEIPLHELTKLDHHVHQKTSLNHAGHNWSSYERKIMISSPASFSARRTQLELPALHRHSVSSTNSHNIIRTTDHNRSMKPGDAKVLQKIVAHENLKALSGERNATHFRQTLQQEFESTNLNNADTLPQDLEVASSVLDDIIRESPTFSYILHCVKTEYDNYIIKLLKNRQPHPDHLRSQIDQLISGGTSDPQKMAAARQRLQSLEADAKHALHLNQRLKEQVKSELDILNKSQEMPAVKKPAVDGSQEKQQPVELSTALEHMKALILEKMDELNDLRHQIRTEYVSVTVCTHLQQCIKETEVEVQKLLKQNEYFERSIAEMESELEEAIVQADTSEKDARRIWRKVNSTRGVPGVQKSKETENDEDSDDESKWNWYIS